MGRSDPAVALGIAALAVREGHETWQGEDCCTTLPIDGEPKAGRDDGCGR